MVRAQCWPEPYLYTPYMTAYLAILPPKMTCKYTVYTWLWPTLRMLLTQAHLIHVMLCIGQCPYDPYDPYAPYDP
jgi:hypothetical protein